jgi:site-specific DNA recombinase
VGIVRVSRVGARDGESFASPGEQRERIAAACERDGLKLVDVIEELDVSGGTPLDKRKGLRHAVELVEAGRADVVVVAYLDRLVRSLEVQNQVVTRVEKAGGAVLAIDSGPLTNGSAGGWLSGTMLGAVAEYQRRVTSERTHEAKQRAMDRGVPPFPNVPPGYRRAADKTLEPDPATREAVVEAFRLRAQGATVEAVRDHLRAHGVKRSLHGVQALLASRIYLGELHFGQFRPNLSAHPPLIDAGTFARVQRQRSARGPRPKSDRLLARLGIVRCGTCGARMVTGSTKQNGRTYPLYRCLSPHDECPRRASVSGPKVEAAVEEEARRLLAGMQGRASAGDEAQAATRDLDARQAELDEAMRTFKLSGVAGEPVAVERLAELLEARDLAADKVSELADITDAPFVFDPQADWGLLTLEERRALVRAVLGAVRVAPGRGADRLTFEPRGQ